MSDDERNHPATERQRQRFRERGEVARSRELTGAAVFLVGATGLAFGLGNSTRVFAQLYAESVGRMDSDVGAALGPAALRALVYAAGPLLLLCLAVAVLVGLAQTGGLVRFEALEVDLEKLNPLPRLQQMFASTDALLGIVVSCAKVGVVAYVALGVLRDRVPALVTGEQASLADALGAGSELLAALVLRAGAVLVVFAAAEYGLSWFKLERRMMMTANEVKEDTKEENGDPIVRAARKRRARELLKARSTRAVAKADVVVVNPTHYAVAIRYDGKSMRAPKVVAKGADLAAERIRAEARRHQVPVLSQPPLARALFRRVKAGREVPADLYQAVAILLAHVYRLRRRAA